MNSIIKRTSTIEILIISLSIMLLILQSCKESGTREEGQSLAYNANIIDEAKTEAPQFTLLSTIGEKVSMKDFSEKILVIHIATTWCPYCNAEAPYLQNLAEKYKDKGVEVLIIDVKENRDLVHTKLVERFNLSFPVLLDYDGEVAASFAPEDVLPELSRDEIMLASNIIIDRNGTIQFMSLLDTKNFDSKLIHLRKKLDELL